MRIQPWLLAVLLATGPVAAQDKQRDARSVASALFDEARRLMSLGKFNDACPKLEESQRLWPGVGTLFNLASCYEKVGRSATAWTTYREALSQAVAAGQKERAEVIRGRVRALEPSLAKLVLEVSSPVTGLTVTRDGVEAAAPLWGVPVPVDPGEHVVRANAPGYSDWETPVTVGAASGAVKVLIPPLKRVDELPTVTAQLDTKPSVSSTPPQVRAPPSWQAPVGIAGLAVGGAGLAAGIVIGVMAKSIAAKADCSADNTCSEAGLAERAKAVHLGDVGTAVAVSGIVLAVAGGALLLFAPKSPPPSDGVAVRWGVTPGALWVNGRF